MALGAYQLTLTLRLSNNPIPLSTGRMSSLATKLLDRNSLPWRLETALAAEVLSTYSMRAVGGMIVEESSSVTDVRVP